MSRVEKQAAYLLDKLDNSPDKLQTICEYLTNNGQLLLQEELEKWIKNHPDDKFNKPYLVSGTKQYTLKEVLENIENNTKFGLSMQRNIILLALDLLTRGKRNL